MGWTEPAETDNNHRAYVRWLTSGIRYLRAHFGERFAGMQGLLFDTLSEGMRYGFYAHLPGYHYNTEDTLDLQGEGVDLFRFRLESPAQWRERIRSRWADHEQGGTPQQMIKAVQEWGAATYGWDPEDPSNLDLIENTPEWWEFQLSIQDGRLNWTPGELWGNYVEWGDGTRWSIGDAHTQDLDIFWKLVKKWKRASSVAYFEVINGPYTIVFRIY